MMTEFQVWSFRDGRRWLVRRNRGHYDFWWGSFQHIKELT